MTARSLTESGYDPKSWHAGYSEGNSHGFESRDAEVEDLRDSRERAIRWAVTLEGQLAAIEKLCAEWEADEQEHLARFGQHLACSLAVPAEQLRAALTGSTE